MLLITYKEILLVKNMDTGSKIVAVLGTIFSVIFYSMALYGTVAEQHDTVLFMKSDYSGITTVVINDKSRTFNLDVVFVDDAENLANITWHAIKFGIINDANNPLPAITINNYTANNILTITIDQLDTNSENQMVVMGGIETQLKIELSTGYTYEFNADKTTGNINLVADKIDFTKLNLVQSTGDTKLVLSNVNIVGNIAIDTDTGDQDVVLTNVNLQGNISMIGSTSNGKLLVSDSTIQQSIYSDRSTGDMSITLNNATFVNNVEITHIASTGDFDLLWNQNKALTKNVSIYTDTSTGNQIMKFNIPYTSVKYQVQASASMGKIRVNSQDYGDTADHSSDNHNIDGLALVDIQATASTGNINIVYSK